MWTLLIYCASPRDRVSIQARLNLKDQSNVRERYLVPAVAAGWLTMTDPSHPSSPAQKYWTTPQGLALLNVEGQVEEQDEPAPVL